MKIRELVGELVQDFKAWRRGEARVAPRGTRGRVYARPNEVSPDQEEASAGYAFRAEPVVELTMQVTRVDGSVEVIRVPANMTRS